MKKTTNYPELNNAIKKTILEILGREARTIRSLSTELDIKGIRIATALRELLDEEKIRIIDNPDFKYEQYTIKENK